MTAHWKSRLVALLRERYVKTTPPDWCSVEVSSSGHASVTIVSQIYEEMLPPERRAQLEAHLTELQINVSLGFVALYSPEEADSLGLRPPADSEAAASVYTWHELAERVSGGPAAVVERPEGLDRPRTVAFYSFKGGVGRTTALVHVATHLARAGRKVVVVDLDLEAPGLSSAMDIQPTPKHGIVDYLYDRAFLPTGIPPQVPITEVFGEVRVQDATGFLYVVPAGQLTLDYVAKVDMLRSPVASPTGKNLWATFISEITDQVRPDLILVDSRTGINEWGALSLLTAADEVIAFLFPNEQNRQGASVLLRALQDYGMPVHIVFSPVPLADGEGKKRVQEQWEKLSSELRDQSSADAESGATQLAGPVVVPYEPAIALVDRYATDVVPEAYRRIAGIVEREMVAAAARGLLRAIDRAAVLAEMASSLEGNEFVQRTADFPRVVDDAISLIRGHYGAGKTTLYRFLLSQEAGLRAAKRPVGSVCHFSGFGSQPTGPVPTDFAEIDAAIRTQPPFAWAMVWCALLLLQVPATERIKPRVPGPLQHIRDTWKPGDPWQPGYTKALLDVIQSESFQLATLETVRTLNNRLADEGIVYRFLYDELDTIPNEDGLRDRALAGLLELVHQGEQRRWTAIRIKIFLDELVWNFLGPAQRRQFNGKNVLLRWSRVEYVRYIYQLAIGAKQYKELSKQYLPVDSVYTAVEEELERALQFLWGGGIRAVPGSPLVVDWLFEHLKDANESVYPGVARTFLAVAVGQELESLTFEKSDSEDRLLGFDSVRSGVKAAAKDRLSQLVEAYPLLQRFVNKDKTELRDELNELPLERTEEALVTMQGTGFAEFGKPGLRVANIYSLPESPK